MSAAHHLAALGGQKPVAPEWFDRAVGHKPEKTRLVVQGVEIETLSWGPRGAPGVLLTHGARAHAGWWSCIAPRLTGHRVTALSWSGMGGSGWRPSYDVGLYTEEAMAAAERTGLFESATRPTFVGHSFGGYPLVGAASLWGNRLSKIVFVDSTLAPFHHQGEAPKGRFYDSLPEALARFRLDPEQDCLPYVVDWLARGGLKTTLGDDGRLRWTWCFDPALFIGLGAVEVGSRLKDAQCPLIFIRGERSALVTEAVESRQRLDAPAGTRFLTLAKAGHHVIADQPEALVNLLRQLL